MSQGKEDNNFIEDFLRSDYTFFDDFLNDEGLDLLDKVSEETKLKMNEHKKILDLNKSGYAGIGKHGTIVDRRKFPNAIPVPKNRIFGVVTPKKLDNE